MNLRTALLALLLLTPLVSRGQDAPDVVATLGPIHSLTAAVMHGAGSPRLLVPAGASPHSYALLPSDARALAAADLVVWVGPELERFLVKPLTQLAGDAQILELASVPGLTRLEAREQAQWEPDHSQDDEHAHAGADMHIWLDPLNAIRIGESVADRLAQLDPARAAVYRQNATTLTRRLQALHEQTEQALAPVRDKPFVVFHDAYHYFEHRYGLHAAAAVTVTPDQPPGARQVARIRELIENKQAKCVFREPQFESGLLQTLVRGTSAKVGVLDPEGAGLTPGPEAYFQLIDDLTASLVGCLKD